MMRIQLPQCLEKCVEIIADNRAQMWREKMVVDSFESMVARNATLLEVERAYDAICFEAVTFWVDESVLVLSETQYEYFLASRKLGTAPCIIQDYDSYPVFSTGYDIVEEADEILLGQEALEQDARGKNCDTCKTMGSACGSCSVTLLEGI